MSSANSRTVEPPTCPICGGTMQRDIRPESTARAVGDGSALPSAVPAAEGWECQECEHWIYDNGGDDQVGVA
jgi:hypothetical protein